MDSGAWISWPGLTGQQGKTQRIAKSVKLDGALKLIKQGWKANAAGDLTGYNISFQFCWGYKRHFGFAPSATPIG